MILIINTNGIQNSIYLYKNKKIQYEKSWKVVTNNRKDVLKQIDIILQINKISLTKIKAIIVYCGPGSLTSVRVGICIANTLAWTLNIPVFGIKGCKYNQNEIELKEIKIIDEKNNKKNNYFFANPVKQFYTTSL